MTGGRTASRPSVAKVIVGPRIREIAGCGKAPWPVDAADNPT